MPMNSGSSNVLTCEIGIGIGMRNALTDPVTLTFDLWAPKQYHF